MIYQLIAQASDPWTLPRLLELGLGGTAFGLVIWLVRHVTTKTIPDIMTQHKITNEAQLTAFERINREQRVEFREILESDRQLHHAREEAMRSEFRAAINKFENTLQRLDEQVAENKQ